MEPARRSHRRTPDPGLPPPPLLPARAPLSSALGARLPAAHSEARLGPRLRPPHAGCTATARQRSDRFSASPGCLLAPVPGRGCRCCRWSGWRRRSRCRLFPDCSTASAPAAAAPADSPPPFLSSLLPPSSFSGVCARGLHGWLWQELARVCACVSVRVWRAPEPCSLAGVEEENEAKRRRRRQRRARAARWLPHQPLATARPTS